MTMPESTAGDAPPTRLATSEYPLCDHTVSPSAALNTNSSLAIVTTNTRPSRTVGAERIGFNSLRRQITLPEAELRAATSEKPVVM